MRCSCTALVVGATVIGISFAVLYYGGELFSMTVKITGIFGSPVGALFLMGILFPSVDSLVRTGTGSC